MIRATAVLFAAAAPLWAGASTAGDKDIRFGFDPAERNVRIGTPVSLSLGIRLPDKAAHIAPESPLKITLTGEGVTLPKAALTRKDGEDPGGGDGTQELRFEVPLTVKKKGKSSVRAGIEFFYCTEKICLKEELQAEARLTAE